MTLQQPADGGFFAVEFLAVEEEREFCCIAGRHHLLPLRTIGQAADVVGALFEFLLSGGSACGIQELPLDVHADEFINEIRGTGLGLLPERMAHLPDGFGGGGVASRRVGFLQSGELSGEFSQGFDLATLQAHHGGGFGFHRRESGSKIGLFGALQGGERVIVQCPLC